MALPQRAIDELGHEPRLTPGWSGKLIMFTSIIFVFALVVYIGLEYGYLPYLKSKITETNTQIDDFRKEISPEKEAELINFYSQLANTEDLLKSQEYVSSFFPWLEINTHHDVFYSLLAADLKKREVLIRGRARNPEALVQQLSRFEDAPDLASIRFTGTSLDPQGFWTVDVTLVLAPSFFKTPLPLRGGNIPPSNPPPKGASTTNNSGI